jgi:DNA-binding LacI/PurR family transcriptional regulator
MVVRQRRWGTIVANKTSRRIGRVAFLVDQFAQDYNFPSGDLIRGIQDTIGEETHLMIAESRSDPDTEIRQIRKFQNEVDGLILYPTSHPRSRPTIQRVIDTGLPLVILDRLPEGIRADAVMSDNEGATLKAIRALEALGHRRIGFFSFYKPDFSTVAERHSAYRLALAEVGVEDVTELTRWFPRELDGNPQAFVQAISDSLFTLVHQPEPITALFCVQDSFAAAVLQACNRLEISVPRDLELATFNDWPPMMLRAPWSIHRIVQNSYEIGRVAADLLLHRLNGSHADPKTVRVEADFVVAESGVLAGSRNHP